MTEYVVVHFREKVLSPLSSGSAGVARLTSEPSKLRLYRDPSDPGTLVAEATGTGAKVHVPWSVVASAKVAKVQSQPQAKASTK